MKVHLEITEDSKYEFLMLASTFLKDVAALKRKAPEAEIETKAPEAEVETKAPEAEVETKAPEAEVETNAPEAEVEVDSEGTPWDERIHASTKATRQDGTWKKRRGVSQNKVEQVEAELRNSDINTFEEEAQLAPVPPKPDNVPAPPPAPEAPSQNKSTATPRSYAELMSLVTGALSDAETCQEASDLILQALGAYGLESTKALQDSKPEFIGEVYDAIEERISKAGV